MNMYDEFDESLLADTKFNKELVQQLCHRTDSPRSDSPRSEYPGRTPEQRENSRLGALKYWSVDNEQTRKHREACKKQSEWLLSHKELITGAKPYRFRITSVESGEVIELISTKSVAEFLGYKSLPRTVSYGWAADRSKMHVYKIEKIGKEKE